MNRNITLVSPYHGGSHRAWATGYERNSRHRVNLLTLPARFWKWRMHGGAVTLARRFRQDGRFANTDLLLATDMLDLTTFLALTRWTGQAVLYMHENQLTYPLPADPTTGPMRRQLGQRDQHYAFINYASMLAADRVLFNSEYHRRSFFDALTPFLSHFPEDNEMDTVAGLAERSLVLPVGIDLERLGAPAGEPDPAAPPLILWNQRWEYDKNPAAFFDALYAMRAEGIPFRLALCGQNFRQRPAEFETALGRLADLIVHVGYAPAGRYRELLWETAVVISTARHEFFGISILEAIFCRALPLLPARLSYPELLPVAFHERCLYDDQAGLVERLRWALTHPEETAELTAALAPAAATYSWRELAPRYDALLAAVE